MGQEAAPGFQWQREGEAAKHALQRRGARPPAALDCSGTIGGCQLGERAHT